MKKISPFYLSLTIALLTLGSACVREPQQNTTKTEAPTKKETPTIDPRAQNTTVTYRTNPELTGYLCKPAGAGPFPVVTYHHGGKEGAIGGAPEETCAALAKAGYVGFAPIRREDLSFDLNLTDVQAGIEYALRLPYVDPSRHGILGFSRGGILSFMAATARTDLDAIVIMASAPPRDEASVGESTKKITAPVLVQVAENDLPSKLNGGQNLVEQAKKMNEALVAAGKDVTLTIYPPYKDIGHLMFFEIGAYWNDVISFLNKHL